MNQYCIFSDESEMFRSPAHPRKGDTVQLYLRAAAGADIIPELIHDGEHIPMEKVREDGTFAWYGAETGPLEDIYRYHFEVHSQDEPAYLSRLGFTYDMSDIRDFEVIPGLAVPDWSRGAVIYQIYPDRFRNGYPDNYVHTGEYDYPGFGPVIHREWDEPVKADDVNVFYGGDLQGVAEKLDYLQDLGVEVVYFNPIFCSPSSHGYDITDYDHIDPHISDPDDPNGYFAQLTGEIHRRGMKVILDGVFNHCSRDHHWVSDPDKQDWIVRNDDGRPMTWWGVDTLPKLNYRNPELRQAILDVGAKWVSPPYNCDGWRLDVAADLGQSPEENAQFWREFREAVKAANPEAFIIAEEYSGAEKRLQGDQWDSIIDFCGFMDPVSWFFTGIEKHSDAEDMWRHGDGERFLWDVLRCRQAFPYDAALASHIPLDNHDHSRFLTRTNGTVGRLGVSSSEDAETGTSKDELREAVTLQMTWPGAPVIYYGDEAGLAGWTDPDNRRPYPWGHEDWLLMEYYRHMIWLHRLSPALRRGSFCPLDCGTDLLAWGRFTEDDMAVTVINHSCMDRGITLDLGILGLEGDRLVRRAFTYEGGYNLGAETVPLAGSNLILEMPPRSAMVLTLK